MRAVSFAGMACVLVSATVVAQAQTWTLQWSDEFNASAGTTPSSESWTLENGGGGWGNGEIQVYCAPGSNTSPCDSRQPNLYQDGDGHLVMRAIHVNGAWTSGRMNTSGKKTFQYGRMEARMKLQVADGFWPAFWMLGSNIDSVNWPESGEQDIMEWVQSYGAGTTSSTIHGPGYSGAKSIGSKFMFPNGGRIDDGEYHTYGVIWSKNRLQFYRDNPMQPFFTLTPASLPSGKQWVYNQPFFLLLNFAIGGGGFPGATDSSTPNFGTALVDYVRVYQTSSVTNPKDWYIITNVKSGACLDGAALNGILLQTRACGGSPNSQQWQFTPVSGGYYTAKNRSASLGWDTAGGPSAVAAGRKIQLRSDTGAIDEQWMPVSFDTPTYPAYKFVNRDSGLCLDGSAVSTANGVQLQQEPCDGTAGQAFTLTQQP
jgi:beta-glucanase (GH16 family)